MSLLLGLKPGDSKLFRDLCLGNDQLQSSLKAFKSGKRSLRINYCGEKEILSFNTNLQALETYPDLIYFRHVEAPQSPFTSDPLSYPYVLKISVEARYLFVNETYRASFIEPQRQIIGEDAITDIEPESKADCLKAAEQALKKPGEVVSVALLKKSQGGQILSTAWQFVALNEGEFNPVVYARGYDVSELKAAEDLIIRGQSELDAFFNNGLNAVFFMMLPEPLLIEDAEQAEPQMEKAFRELRITRANPKFLEQYGLQNEEECLGMSPKDFMEHEPNALFGALKELFKEGKVHNVVEDQNRKGQKVIIEGDYLLLKEGPNKILGVVGIQQDITENYRQREQVRNSILKLQKLTENIPGIVFQMDVNEKGSLSLEFLSEAFDKADLGLEKEGLLENPASILDRISPKDYSTVLGSIIYVARKKEELQIEFRIEDKMGNERWFMASARPELGDGGQKISWFGILRSIDAQKDFERQQFKLAQIARNTSDLIMVIDAMGKLDWVNTSCLQYFEWDKETLLQSSPFEFLTPGSNSENFHKLQDAIENQRGINIKVKLLHQGEPRWMQVRNKPVWNANGEFLFSLVVMQDIDQEETKNLEMESLLNLTSEQNKRLQSFTYIISHNIRSHSANFQGILEAIEETDDAEEKEELWAYLHQVSEGLESTIKHLNEIIVINQSLNKNKQTLSLKGELERVLRIVEREVQALKAELVFDFDADQKVLAVKAYLESILMNLITNALRYRHPERTPIINISCKKKDDLLFIRVKDNGLGMDLERYGNRLFQLYQTFHDNPQSRGLGLYILKNQVESMGGVVEVKSKPNKGTTFSVGLPHDL